MSRRPPLFSSSKHTRVLRPCRLSPYMVPSKSRILNQHFFSMPMNHTQYKCVDEIPRVNDGNEIGASAFQAGIVSTDTQESPQERNWRCSNLPDANTPSGLNLEAHKVNHFSQANHPSVRRQLNGVFNGDIHRNNPPLRDAFRVR